MDLDELTDVFDDALDPTSGGSGRVTDPSPARREPEARSALAAPAVPDAVDEPVRRAARATRDAGLGYGLAVGRAGLRAAIGLGQAGTDVALKVLDQSPVGDAAGSLADRLEPAAERGRRQREATAEQVEAVVGQVVDDVVEVLDIDGIIRQVDIDDIVRRVDVDADRRVGSTSTTSSRGRRRRHRAPHRGRHPDRPVHRWHRDPGPRLRPQPRGLPRQVAERRRRPDPAPRPSPARGPRPPGRLDGRSRRDDPVDAPWPRERPA